VFQVGFPNGFADKGDWTAIVPSMRPFLQLKSLDDVSLKRESVQLSEIELVSDRVAKARFLDRES
jgi:hypothetical protein